MQYVLLVSALACGLFAIAAAKADFPASIHFESDLGPVTFTHEQHIRKLANDCSVCHHEGSGHYQACRQCHNKKRDTAEDDPLPFYDVKMQFCRGCHVTEKEKDSGSAAPVGCSDCHDIRAAAHGA
ncbi:MAG TPA: cytochrome c3 family protein [Thermodesulfobacteriota bacterium]|nr:cytochrome c3 family protein [Deltaproteobacteria bacterium]HOC39188.1 cytochrome c3 family protein [Thermodesulfobacteriota bacterium]